MPRGWTVEGRLLLASGEQGIEVEEEEGDRQMSAVGVDNFSFGKEDAEKARNHKEMSKTWTNV